MNLATVKHTVIATATIASAITVPAVTAKWTMAAKTRYFYCS